MLLDLKSVCVSYGKATVLREITMMVPDGAIVTIIGANGAGKTTTLRAISGLAKPISGEIRFSGKRIDGLPPDQIVAAGLVHVPEGRRVFPELTVEENLRMGAFLRRDRRKVLSDVEFVFEQFPGLFRRRNKNAKTLSGGEQQMLAIGRALMARPRLILMDEPSMGLAPVVVDQIAAIIRRIRDQGVPVVLVEQNAELALSLADHAYVMETGSVVLSGGAKALRNDKHVRAAYLGI